MEIQPIQLPISLTQPQGMNPITPITAGAMANTQELTAVNFKDLVKKAMVDLNTTQIDANNAMQGLATGSAENIHDVIMAMEKARMTLQYATQIRNKLLEAYQSVIQMQV